MAWALCFSGCSLRIPVGLPLFYTIPVWVCSFTHRLVDGPHSQNYAVNWFFKILLFARKGRSLYWISGRHLTWPSVALGLSSATVRSSLHDWCQNLTTMPVWPRHFASNMSNFIHKRIYFGTGKNFFYLWAWQQLLLPVVICPVQSNKTSNSIPCVIKGFLDRRINIAIKSNQMLLHGGRQDPV